MLNVCFQMAGKPEETCQIPINQLPASENELSRGWLNYKVMMKKQLEVSSIGCAFVCNPRHGPEG